jgi:sulfur relay (sulfurtransferase) DsrF/TusC family protein
MQIFQNGTTIKNLVEIVLIFETNTNQMKGFKPGKIDNRDITNDIYFHQFENYKCWKSKNILRERGSSKNVPIEGITFEVKLFDEFGGECDRVYEVTKAKVGLFVINASVAKTENRE